MTLKQLEAFYLAATLGSFALAAQRAHVTQSSLSKRIAELEAWVGVELFDRSGQRAQLTEAGHRLLPVAAQMLEIKQSIRDALHGLPTLAGTCRELHGGQTGDLKVIAQLAKSRSPALPNVPTAEEAGVPVFMSSERGFAVPKDAPETIVRALEAAIAESVRDPEFIASSPGDAPVLSHLLGTQWRDHLNEYAKTLRALADRIPK
jgi:regulatory helix-turn-helix LysR family protein/tripartite tricarboxylate transporter family receptor